jgi:hypothetical protein
MAGRSFTLFELFRVKIRRQVPSIRQMFTMFEPRTFPMATPMLSCPITEKIDTHSSGKDVEKATNMNPIVVFPKPVISATFTELVIVQSLALYKASSEATRINALPNGPHPSNIAASPFLLIPSKTVLKTFLATPPLPFYIEANLQQSLKKATRFFIRKNQKIEEKF